MERHPGCYHRDTVPGQLTHSWEPSSRTFGDDQPAGIGPCWEDLEGRPPHMAGGGAKCGGRGSPGLHPFGTPCQKLGAIVWGLVLFTRKNTALLCVWREYEPQMVPPMTADDHLRPGVESSNWGMFISTRRLNVTRGEGAQNSMGLRGYLCMYDSFGDFRPFSIFAVF